VTLSCRNSRFWLTYEWHTDLQQPGLQPARSDHDPALEFGHGQTDQHTERLQTNGICERFHKTILQEFYQVAFRRKIYRTTEELQSDLDQWIAYYNQHRTHQGKMCNGRTPMQTMLEAKEVYNAKVNDLN
jgi:transposase InsO family protein